MNKMELNQFLQQNRHIECRCDDLFTYFRNTNLPFYANNPGSSTRIDNDAVERLTADELLLEINRGLEVEHITRITGYFTKVSHWNKGKLGELRDRVRSSIV